MSEALRSMATSSQERIDAAEEAAREAAVGRDAALRSVTMSSSSQERINAAEVAAREAAAGRDAAEQRVGDLVTNLDKARREYDALAADRARLVDELTAQQRDSEAAAAAAEAKLSAVSDQAMELIKSSKEAAAAATLAAELAAESAAAKNAELSDKVRICLAIFNVQSLRISSKT